MKKDEKNTSGFVYLFDVLRQEVEAESQIPDAVDDYHWPVGCT